MSGFDVNEFLPFYLDETDEQIAQLSDALLRLEDQPDDEHSLREAFRMAHSIKGSARLLGFAPVEQLTHHLESYFDQLRGGKRALERPCLDICFQCLDALRDYHRKLRSEGQSDVDLSACTELIVQVVEGKPLAPPSEPGPGQQPEPQPTQEPGPAREPRQHVSEPAMPEGAAADLVVEPLPQTVGATAATEPLIRVVVVFEPQLPWKDMKARLILSRLSERTQVVRSEPPAERLDAVESLPAFTVWLAFDGNPEELRALADVDGVTSLRFERVGDATEPAETTATTGTIAAAEPLARAEPQPAEPVAAASETKRIAAPQTSAPSARKTRIAETLRVDVDRLDNLMNLAGELVINKARFGQIMGGLREIYGGLDLQIMTADTEDRFDSFAKALDQLERTSADADVADGPLRGQFRRLRENIGVMLGQLKGLRRGQEHLQAMTEAMDQLTRIAEGIQKGVLDTRMVPIGPLFDRFKRVVRDISIASGKQVELKLAGESTELDKRMIDELADPLVHMIRNAVDHGLEPPEQRLRLGKPTAGTVSLQAAHRGNSVVITVTDDGRGIDPERIRRKIVAQGLAREAEALAMSDRQLISYIWHPGLSTAERVTDISGRGVGMDIVRSHIENLSGSVDVRTDLGRGTTFTIRLPLTLAILPSLVVRIYDEYYAIPLDAADEIVEVRGRDVRRIHGTTTFENRGRVLALLELNDVFRWGGTNHPSYGALQEGTAGDPAAHWTVVLVQNGETTMGLRVNELVGIQEVVLKSIERNFRPIPGLSGASILGDGRVSLILDVDLVLNMATNGAPEAAARLLASSA